MLLPTTRRICERIMRDSSASNEMVIAVTKTAVVSETAYSTTEAVENDEICGYEVTVTESESWVTVSTDPLSSQSTEEETQSIQSGDAMISSPHFEDAIHSPDSEGGRSDRIEELGKWRVGNPHENSIIRSRVEDLFDVLDNDDESATAGDPILMLQVEYVEHHREKRRGSKHTTGQNHIFGITQANFNLEKEFFNLLEPAPDSIFSDLFARSRHSLCQVMLGAFDVSFLLNTYGPTSPSPSQGSLHTPFMMFPEENRALVSVGSDKNYTVSSSGPMSQGVLSQLFLCQSHLLGQNVRVNSFAYRDGLPSISGTEPVHLESNMFHVRLNGWKRSRSGPEVEDQKPDSVVDGENKSPSSGESKERKYLIPNTELIPFMTGKGKSDAVADLVTDEELKAFLKITKDGEEASPLFPSFSLDDMASELCSNDGLDEELGALEYINNELRKELAFADVVINGTSTTESGESAQRKLRKKIEKVLELPDSDSGLQTHPTKSDTLATLSTTDSETDSERSHDLLDSSIATSCCVPEVPESAHRRKARRHVRFAEMHDEYIYLAHLPIIGGEGRYDDRKGEPNGQFNHWYEKFEDAYVLFEDVIDDLALGCTNYMDRKRPQPSTNKKVRVSTVYYT